MISPLDEASQVDADAVAWPTTFLRCGDTDVCQRVHARILELTQIYTHTAGMAGIYAACALLRLATNVPAELWVPANDEQTQAIEAILRRHALVAESATI